MESRNHLEIFHFYSTKTYLITGATGFLAKVLVEKMLREFPDIEKMYLIIRAKDDQVAMKRFEVEILKSELFKSLKNIHGEFYENFMKSKLVPLAGDISLPGFGMTSFMIFSLAQEVDIIISSAANTSFDERYDISLNTNTEGPRQLMSFAKTCRKLCVFVQISTAYVNSVKKMLILENSLSPTIDIDAEIKLVYELKKSLHRDEVDQRMKALALERANIHGWISGYTLAKAMGEMVLNEMRGDIPIVIIRPNIIESTYNEPFSGWIQGYRMIDPVIMSYGKGLLPCFLANPETIIDIIPVDMVANTIVAAMTKHGIAAKPGLRVYHTTSSVANPIMFQEIFQFCHEYFSLYPLLDAKGNKITGIDRLKIFNSMEEYSNYNKNNITRMHRNGLLTIDEANKILGRTSRLARVYEPYTFYEGLLDNTNTMKLMEEMSEEELKIFKFDVRCINWEHYFKNIHIPGNIRDFVNSSNAIKGNAKL